jgi:DNA polymerase III subunit delta
MKANAGQIRAAMAKPDPAVRLFLLHGPDAAGAADLAGVLARAMGADAERIDLEGASLRSDPARLADEAAALSLFGGARHIRVTQVGEESLDAMAGLLDAERAGNPVVAIAPSLKTTAKLVKLATDHPRAMAHGCYLPEGRRAEEVVVQIAGELGLRPAPGVAHRLADAAGGDRAIVARECEKLALYLDAAPDRPRELTHDALDAVGADLHEAEAAGLVEALLRGEPASVGGEAALMEEANVSPVTWLRAVQRRLVQLAEMRAGVDAGEPIDRVVDRQRLPFSQKDATAAALRRWTAPMLAVALDRVRAAERAVMAPDNPGAVVAADAMTALARRVARRG